MSRSVASPWVGDFPVQPRFVSSPPPVTLGVVLRVIVRTLGEISITLGVVTLLFVVWQLWWTDIEANREQSRLTESLESRWETSPVIPAASSPIAVPAPVAVEPVAEDSVVAGPVAGTRAPLAPAGDAFAILRLPSLGAGYEEPVLAGTGSATLQRGIGHYNGTAGPGEIGNFALAGHRTTYGAPFSRVAELRDGDPIVVQTVAGYYVYRVSATEIVSPAEVGVIAPVPNDPAAAPTSALITLTTCHPKYSARQRYIVHGVFVASAASMADVQTVLAQG